MATITQVLILLVFSTAIVEARILRLNSFDDHLISDGLEYHGNQTRAFNMARDNGPSSCDHQYGFLPCAENVAGFVFQIFVYQGLLIFGEKQIGGGSKVLFNIMGVGKFGGIIFRILMVLPSMMLMIVSGVFSSKENVQSQVSIGVGIYAGITVFSLTVHWGICVIFGRKGLNDKSNEDPQTSITSNCLQTKEKLIILKDTGVEIDQYTRYTAGIMLLSLIPYIIVQLEDFLDTSGNRVITLIALVVSALLLISYFVYQVLYPWMQQRSLDYSKYEMLRKGFLNHIQRQGQLVNEDGKLNLPLIEKLFEDTDKDENKRIGKTELESLVLDIIKMDKVKIDEGFAISQVMEVFDFDHDSSINMEEFTKGCKKWIDETKGSPGSSSDSGSGNIFHELFKTFKEKKHDDPQKMDQIMSKILKHAQTQLLKSEYLITDDGKPNVERIQALFKKFDSDGDRSISKTELEKLISTVKFGEFQPKYEDIVKEMFKDFDKDNNSIIDEPEFVEGVQKWVDKAVQVANTPDRKTSIDEFEKIVWKQAVNKWALFTSLFQVLLGIVILTFLGGPLMGSILQLSFAMGFPSFSISFVIVPLAMNARAVITAIFPASQKSILTASLTFSEIYGGVIMNNIAGLTTLLALVYAKDLTWDFSAEVLTILAVCAIVGTLAYSSTTYPLWTCILAFFLYPFSLGLFYFAQVFWRWN